ncbi:hypothetical protein GCM10011316_25800 [Roseibium aquae]|uniref:Beta-barrel assembly complex subunit BamF n=1 Tax=Roseibium aquae TaxID=1323746 RepID=A0A916TLU7_9HYPH|nr:hypothetical protein [Roseibium aquae]GGB52603.1 hypothetical protein GCM10011316_25800 [Roseibium aquae]
MQRTKSIASKIVLLTLAGGLLAACQAADGTMQAPDTAAVNRIMQGLGAIDPNEKPIDYKPRAPLAMPADKSNLPPPETQTAGAGSENWPNAGKNPEIEELRALYANANRSNQPLSPEQMRGFTLTGVDRPSDRQTQRQRELADGAHMTPEELQGRGHSLSSGEAETPTARLQRRYLTEPPTAYNEPSANAPFPTDVKAAEKQRMKDAEDPMSGALIDMRCLEAGRSDC